MKEKTLFNVAVAFALGFFCVSIVLGCFLLISHNALMLAMRNNNDLTERYADLIVACNSSRLTFGWINEPLTKKVVPSIEELTGWLWNDTTNENEYTDKDFDCFHYAVTLRLHGRAFHYDIGVILLYGQDTFTGAPWFHAINAIITNQGLVYIEPQTDEIYISDNHEITNGTIYFFPGFGPIRIEKTKTLFDY